LVILIGDTKSRWTAKLAGRAHLAGFDPARSPRFRWREAPIPPQARVQLETALGAIELELDAVAAPITAKNFLRYVNDRLYNDGAFFRTVTTLNQPTNTVKIQVVQAEASQARTNEFYPAIPLERTRDTGLKHLDGTISMARLGPDTAQDNFFICIGDQPDWTTAANATRMARALPPLARSYAAWISSAKST
jgi:peptidyl-prolyl cis-trans isomerase A (cyclophilin A)